MNREGASTIEWRRDLKSFGRSFRVSRRRARRLGWSITVLDGSVTSFGGNITVRRRDSGWEGVGTITRRRNMRSFGGSISARRRRTKRAGVSIMVGRVYIAPFGWGSSRDTDECKSDDATERTELLQTYQFMIIQG